MKQKHEGAKLTLPMPEADWPYLEVQGNFRLLADGCIGVLHYDEKRVCLNCGKLVIEVKGKNLSIAALGENMAEVTGTLEAVVLQ